MVFKKKEIINRINFSLTNKEKISYKPFIEKWSKTFNSFFPIFTGLLATIFITFFIKDMSIPPGELFSSILTLAFSLVVLSSLLVSIIVAGILYMIMVLGFGSLIYLIYKIIDKIIVKKGFIPVVIIILLLFLIGVPLSLMMPNLTFLWMVGLILESIGIVIGMHLISSFLENKNSN